MTDYRELGYDQFLRRELHQDVLGGGARLNESSLGPTWNTGDVKDNIPAVPVDMVVGDILANSIAANSITAAMIQAGAVTSAKINVASLDAITATMGNLTAGTITGSTLQTGTVGENVNITSAYISLRNSTSETGYLRGYQTEDRFGAPLNKSEIGVSGAKIAQIFTSGESGFERLGIFDGGGGGTLDMPIVIASTFDANYDLNVLQPLALVSSSLIISSDTVGSAGVLDLGATGSDLRIRTTSGAPTGGVSGSVALDTTNSRLYAKVGGTWKYAALT